MKKILIFLVLYLLIANTSAYAEKQDLADLDGNEWTEWQSHQKYSFISGFIAGAVYVINNNAQSQDDKYDSDKAAQIYISYALPDQKKPKNTFSRKEVALLLGNQSESFNSDLYRYGIVGITNGQLVEGLNLFYVDFKNKQIKLKDAIYVVKKQIKGASPEEIEAVLQYLRADRDYKKLFYTDKDGKKKYVSFP